MIDVSRLTKTFAATVAVDDLSFRVEPGEVVGFLGPNGAGKTTTMRIITGYLPPSAGVVKVADRNVVTESLEVRRRIGYLPENCPLYLDMRVNEYLNYRAQLKGVPGSIRSKRIDEVKSLCSLHEVGRRIIGQLSKGFKQRVGLADALVHKPQLLVLDEPTLGLDPHQIRHTRELIRELAEKHTILLSTHILSEVEVTCHRVLIINQGKIIAQDTPAELLNRLKDGARLLVELKGPLDQMEQGLRQLPGVLRVNHTAMPDEWFLFSVECRKGIDLRSEVYQASAQNHWNLRVLKREERTLEDAFVELTAKAEGAS
jgi:ABC-2 type transport system ATP-binding protein